MTFPTLPTQCKDFEIAIICEADAIEALFNRFWDDDGESYGKASGDPNAYMTGVIGCHNVILAYMPGMGKGSAASAVDPTTYNTKQSTLLILLNGANHCQPQNTLS